MQPHAQALSVTSGHGISVTQLPKLAQGKFFTFSVECFVAFLCPH